MGLRPHSNREKNLPFNVNLNSNTVQQRLHSTSNAPTPPPSVVYFPIMKTEACRLVAAFFCFWDYNLDKIRKRVNSLTHPLLLAIISCVCAFEIAQIHTQMLVIMVLISTNGTQPQEKIRLANMFNVGPLFNFLTPLVTEWSL